MALRTFEDLEVWKRGCRLAVDVCTKVYGWKNYGLKDQLQRSSISIDADMKIEERLIGETRGISAMLQGLRNSIDSPPQSS